MVVAGSINMDIVLSAHRHPLPGETISGQRVHFFAGGKGANQAIAAHRLGAAAQLVGRIGDDLFGRDLRNFLVGEGLAFDQIYPSKGASGTALIVVVPTGENTIVVVPGANGQLSAADVEVEIHPDDVLISQLEIPIATVTHFFGRGRSVGARTLLNAAPAQLLPAELLLLIDILIVNETELAILSGRTVQPDSPQSVAAAAQLLQRAIETVVVTLGAHGAVACRGTDLLVVPGRRVQAIDATGAGDCFVGALAARLAAGEALEQALGFANVAASLCVERPGAAGAMPTLGQVQAVLQIK